ncbi:MAG: hypothetical protein NW217_07115 [Hyphomicrobiaceae bacterium]|nr:hypothetical protein [Hyphomicrobiaceae bacterium]
MSLSLPEYTKSIEAFAGPEARQQAAAGLPVIVPIGAGTATITYEALPGVRLGGLLELPRAAVAVAFSGTMAADRVTFMQAFDIAFQRGGG